MKKSVETQLIDFLKSNYQWFSSGDLQRRPWFNKDGTLATPRSIVRRLEENTYTEQNPTGILEVDYGNKGAAQYRIKQEHRKMRQIKIDLPDGSARLEYKPY